MGPSGPIGLDYNVLPFAFENHAVAYENQSEMWSDIRIMEGEALKKLGESSGK